MLHSLRRLAVFSVLFLSIGSVLGGTDAVWRWALFSRQQLLWPSLNPAARPDSARVGVLPVYLEQYSESIPCDSCHRLSQDGMEFFFGNALTRILDMALPGQPVELVAPHWDLLRSRHVTFPQDLDSLKLPWGKWLPEGE